MQRFINLIAWFSKSVSNEIKDLWEENGGNVSDNINTANYFFSDDAACKDTVNVFEKFKGQGIVLFKSSWIKDTLGASTNVSIENYILFPKHVSEELELWKNQEAYQKKWNDGKEQREKDWELFREEMESASQHSAEEPDLPSKKQKRRPEAGDENESENSVNVSDSGRSRQTKIRTPPNTKRQATRATKRQLDGEENRKPKRRSESRDVDTIKDDNGFENKGLTEVHYLPKVKERTVRVTRSQKDLCESEDNEEEDDINGEDSLKMKIRHARNTTRTTTRQKRRTQLDDDEEGDERNENSDEDSQEIKTRHSRNIKETATRQKRKIKHNSDDDESQKGAGDSIKGNKNSENVKETPRATKNNKNYSLRSAKKSAKSKLSTEDDGVTERLSSRKVNAESDSNTDDIDFSKSNIARTDASANIEEQEEQAPTVNKTRPKRKSALKAVQKMTEENESESDSKTIENEFESDLETVEDDHKTVPQCQQSELHTQLNNKDEKTGSSKKRRVLHSSSSDLYAENKETADKKRNVQESLVKYKPISPSEIHDVLGKKPKMRIQVQTASPVFPRLMPTAVTTPTASVATVDIDDRNVTSPQDTMEKHKAMLIHKKVGAQSSDFLYGSFAGFPHIDDFNLEGVRLADFIVNKNGCQVKLKSAR